MTENNDEVGCNGKAVKMFAEMVRCSLRDDDFVSCKCTTFNVVLFYYIRFLLMVRFVNDFLFMFFFFFCYRRLFVGYWATVE